MGDTVITEGDLTYIDMGQHWVEVDNRGEIQVTRTLPKAATSVGVSAETRLALEKNIEAFAEISTDDVDPKDNLPPVVTADEAEANAKEAGEALQKATHPDDEAETPAPAPKRTASKEE